MEENLTIEQKANTLIGCGKVSGCKSQFINYCQRSYKDGFMCTQKLSYRIKTTKMETNVTYDTTYTYKTVNK